MHKKHTGKKFQTFRERLYGPGVFTREDDQLLMDGVPVSEICDFPIDRRDADFFSDQAFQDCILNKVVRD